jgi:sialate O-acetylesterase
MNRFPTPLLAARNPFRLLGAAIAAVPAFGAVSVQGLFSDHMVLQRDMPVPVFGAAAPNEAITVKLGARQAEGKAGADGRFLVRLPAQAAGGPFELSISGTNTLTFRDVYVGEVWIGSGQSNMDFRVDCTFSGCALKDEAKEIAAANHPLIRSINIDRKGSAAPTYAMTTGKWMVATPQTVGDFSAVGYFFARELQKSLPGVAVGIVHASYGASCIECWMSRESLAALPSFAPLLTQYERAPNHADQHEPYNCYNGQIFPVKPYAVRGVIWYQGESIKRDPDNMALYRDLQVELVRSWRREWGQDMTFIVAQLAGHNTSSFPVRREAQMQGALMVPNAGFVVTADIGDPANIHPPNKQEVGRRMSLVAQAIAYGQAVEYEGPRLTRMAVEGGSIRLFFKQARGGLLLNGGNAATFEIAGATGSYVPATARVDQDSTLLVSASGVSAPRNARYAWSGLPSMSLFSKAAPALPAPSFRTDAPSFAEVPTAAWRRAAVRTVGAAGFLSRLHDLLGRRRADPEAAGGRPR